ncbi:MAG: hypothetical protein LBC87_07680 [Fibromonadaceae bacterium]|jgi:hypothetical protein|nr:hypothetical protein [Fibromonadaceae bacterium]
MKFRIAFSFSKTERKFRLRFWKWDIWNIDSAQEYENVKNDLSKAGFLSSNDTGEKDSDGGKLLLQALFEPGVEGRIWKASQRFTSRAINIFSVSFENLEIKGTLGDPFYDSIALGMSNGCYFPNWEDENGNWSTKGEIILNTKFFPSVYFAFSVIYETIVFLFLLWRGTKTAKKNPNGENFGSIRRWIFLKTREAL